MLVEGPALRVPMTAIEDAKTRSPHIRNLFCRFSDYLLSQVMQSAACNTFHAIENRAARWLLTAQDRAGDRIVLTQEGLAGLLAVAAGVLAVTTCLNYLISYMPTYAIRTLDLPASTGFAATLVSGIALLVATPLAGHWSDRLGQIRLMPRQRNGDR